MRLASHLALGALGAAAGVLPLLKVARHITTVLVEPARLPGSELWSRDVKAATYAELLVLVLAVPMAAFVFGRLIPDWIRAHGGVAVALPGLAFGVSFVLWRTGLRPRYCLLAGTAAAATTLLTILGPRFLSRCQHAGPS